MHAPDRRTRTGLLIGAVAQFLALCVAFVGSYAGLLFAPSALGQAVIEVLPGWVTVPLIELLQHWAQRLLTLGIVALFLAAGAYAGALALDGRRRDAAVVAAAVAPWVAAVLFGAIFAADAMPVAGVLPDAALGGAAMTGMLALLADGAEPVPAPVRSRRRSLLVALGASAAVGVAGILFGSPLRAIGARVSSVKQAARKLVHAETVTPGDPSFEEVARLTPRLTEIPDHYVVDTALIDPRVDETKWRLSVKGAAERPFSLSYDELLDLDAVEQLHTLECISNEIGGDLISTALWTGVRLRDLIERAAPRANVVDVVLRSVDGYTDSIPLAKALEPRTLVAYLMNGYPLPEEHGFPARVLVPNIYGMKNVKWLDTIDLVTYDFQGYWMERGWSDIAIVNTHARLDTPVGKVKWAGGEIPIAGIANAGSRGISKVEVSTDGGSTWSAAELEPALGPLTWVRWRYRWIPSGTGDHKLVVRATDGTGETQASVRRPPFPSGSTGYDSVEMTVTR